MPINFLLIETRQTVVQNDCVNLVKLSYMIFIHVYYSTQNGKNNTLIFDKGNTKII